MQRGSDRECSVLNGTLCHSLHCKTQDAWKGQRLGRLLWHDIFWLWQGQRAHQLTAAVVASAPSTQTVLQDVKGRGSWGPPWAEELSVADNLWKKEFIFFNSDPWQLLQWLESNCHERWVALTGLSALETQMKTKLGRLYLGDSGSSWSGRMRNKCDVNTWCLHVKLPRNSKYVWKDMGCSVRL